MVSGRLYDRIGSRLGFIFSIVVWSGAAIAHAFARTAGGFKIARGVLGFGEAGNWPGAAKVVGEWFPVRERALGMGIFNTGAAIGGAVSPPIIAWLALTYGWRATFIATGVLGFLWLALWVVVFQVPEKHRWITEEEREHILSDRPAGSPAEADWRPTWLQLLGYRQTWAVVVGRFMTDPIWWLYIFWLPSYFQEARGFSLQQIGWSAWMPFLCAGVGALGGGWASGFLIQRGWSVDRARKTVMAFGALLTPAGILAMRAENPYTALLLMGVVLFGFQVWVNNLQTLPSDFFPKSAVGSVFGPRRDRRGCRQRDLQLGNGPRGGCDGLHADVRRRGRAGARRAAVDGRARGNRSGRWSGLRTEMQKCRMPMQKGSPFGIAALTKRCVRRRPVRPSFSPAGGVPSPGGRGRSSTSPCVRPRPSRIPGRCGRAVPAEAR